MEMKKVVDEETQRTLFDESVQACLICRGNWSPAFYVVFCTEIEKLLI